MIKLLVLNMLEWILLNFLEWHKGFKNIFYIILKAWKEHFDMSAVYHAMFIVHCTCMLKVSLFAPLLSYEAKNRDFSFLKRPVNAHHNKS